MTGKKIVLLARDCDSSLIVYNYLSRFFIIDTIVLEDKISKRKQFLRRVKLIGFWNAVMQVVFMLIIFPFLNFTSQKRKREILEAYDLSVSPLPADKIKRVTSLSSQQGRDLLRKLQPDLLLVNGTRIISKKTLESVPAPFVNIHTGITPAFRGVHGGYWAMAKGKKELFGTTIHYVDPGVDTGGIIQQVFTQPVKADNFYTYPYLQYATVLPVLKDVVQSFTEGNRPEVKSPVTKESSLWFHPTIFQWLANMGRTYVFFHVMLAMSNF
jgi:folate-dependent phosphoribosylglycinamide formyltransferase PurN